MPHPHGQIYAFPFVPPMVQTELDSAAAFQQDHGECLYCRVLKDEIHDGGRIVAENDSFVAFLPFYGRFPSEMQICSRRHFQSLADLDATERDDLAQLLKT